LYPPTRRDQSTWDNTIYYPARPYVSKYRLIFSDIQTCVTFINLIFGSQGYVTTLSGTKEERTDVILSCARLCEQRILEHVRDEDILDPVDSLASIHQLPW
jgi:hypothetical protein